MKKATCVYLSTFLLHLPAAFTGFFPGKIAIISAICSLILLLLAYCVHSKNDFKEFYGNRLIAIYLGFSTLTYFRAFGNIEIWRDYIYICLEPIYTLLYLSWILSAKYKLLPIVFRSMFTIGLVMNVIILIYPPTDAMMTFQHNALWLCVPLFMAKFIKNKGILAALVFASCFVVFCDTAHRSIAVNFIIAISILITYRILKKFSKFIFLLGSLTPIVLFSLFASGTFNVFEQAENSLDNESSKTEENQRGIYVDSRSAIYNDVIDATITSGELKNAIWGLGGNGKIQVKNNGIASFGYDDKRSRQEAEMLNQIQHGGVVGMFIYGIFILYPAFLSIFKSNNDFSFMIGCFLLFKFGYSFIEDIITFSPHTFSDFLFIGIGLNRKLSKMTNEEISAYAHFLLSPQNLSQIQRI